MFLNTEIHWIKKKGYYNLIIIYKQWETGFQYPYLNISEIQYSAWFTDIDILERKKKTSLLD